MTYARRLAAGAFRARENPEVRAVGRSGLLWALGSEGTPLPLFGHSRPEGGAGIRRVLRRPFRRPGEVLYGAQWPVRARKGDKGNVLMGPLDLTTCRATGVVGGRLNFALCNVPENWM